MLTITLVISFVFFSDIKCAYAQSSKTDEHFELILQVDRGRATWERAILGYEKNFESFYIPVLELSRVVRFETNYNADSGLVSGWFIAPENSFSIDPAAPSYTLRGETFPIEPDDIFIQQFGPEFAEIYLEVGVLNQILPLDLEVDFGQLALKINTEKKLPYELELERRSRQENFLNAQGQGIDTTDFVRIEKPYQMYSNPVIDLHASAQRFSGDTDYTTGNLNVRGRQDLIGFSADYNFDFDYRNEDLETPDNVRFTLTRNAFGDETMPLGIRQLKLGDVSARAPQLVTGNNTGVGFTATSRPVKANRTFDVVTIEGVATPGWEIELYRNNTLLEFGRVSDDGRYVFEDLTLFAGANRFLIVLYGPQGQIEERVEDYSVGGSMLPPGEVEYEVSFVDTDEDLLRFEDNSRTIAAGDNDSDSLAYSGFVDVGVNRNLSLFASAIRSQNRLETSDYVTAGANIYTPDISGRVEAYKQIDGGYALDTRLLTSFKGWNLNARTRLYNDFESDRVGYGDNADVLDFEGRAQKRFSTPLGAASLALSVDHEVEKDDDERTTYRANSSLSAKKVRYDNNLRASYIDRELSRMDGTASAALRLSRNISNRTYLDYELKPERELRDISTDFRYYPNKQLRAGLVLGRNLREGTHRVGGNLSYDFGNVLTGLNAQWNQDNGFNIGLTASTSIAPYGADGEYIMSSESFLGQSAINARLFQDNNLNLIFDEGDTLVPESGVKLDLRDIDETDERGLTRGIVSELGGYRILEYNQEKSPNPFLVSAKKGYLVFARPGISQDVDIPLLESGVMEGNAYFDDGSPIPGLKLRLLNNEGDILQETITSFDGYYTFEFVTPGTYIIRVDPSINVMVPPRIITVSQDALFAYGADVQIIPAPTSSIEVSAQKTVQNKTAIIGALQNLQRTLQGATAGAITEDTYNQPL